MHALPFALSLASAVLLAPAALRTLRAGGHVRENFRGRALPFPFGAVILAAALIALVPLELIQRLGGARVFEPRLAPVLLYCVGVLALGLLDDALGAPRGSSAAPRGWRGHGAAVLAGDLSTGAVKAAGSLGLALASVGALGYSSGRWLLAAAVLVLATNALNLLDLRPGRAAKAFVLLAVGLTLGTRDLRPLWTLGVFTGAALVAAAYDLRERAMLGDTGANLLGALAGLWMVLSLSRTGQIVALALLLALTVYGELRSLSDLIDRVPGLRQLDSWGRPT